MAVVRKDGAVESAEGTEGVGAEKDLFRFLIGKGHFRPVHHGGLQETEPVGAQGNFQLLVGRDEPVREGHVEILARHLLGLGRCDDLRHGVRLRQGQEGAAVVRLHVVDHDIVQGPSVEEMAHIFHEQVPDHRVHRINDRRLLVVNEIAVIGDPLGNGNQVFKPGGDEIVPANPVNIFRYLLFIMHSLASCEIGKNE